MAISRESDIPVTWLKEKQKNILVISRYSCIRQHANAQIRLEKQTSNSKRLTERLVKLLLLLSCNETPENDGHEGFNRVLE